MKWLLILLLCGVAHATIPTAVQDVNFGTNQGGQTFTSWKVHLPNPTIANNALMCGWRHDGPNTVTFTFTDNIGSNTWTNGPVLNDLTDGITVGLTYVLGVAAGTQDLTITLNTAEFDVHLHCTEFAFVATTAATDGNSTATPAAPNIATGAFSTVSDGDLIYHYGIDAGSLCCLTPITAFTAGTSFSLLGNDRFVANAAQYRVQATHGAITPSFTASGADTWATVAMALKADPTKGGLPAAGIHVNCVGRTTIVSASHVFQTPCPIGTNNLLVTETAESAGQHSISKIADSDSNGGAGGYTLVTVPTGVGNDYPQVFYSCNSTFTSSNSRTTTATNTFPGGATAVIVYYMVSGAATSCFDTKTTNTGNQVSAGGATCASNVNHDSSISITPSTTNGLIIGSENNGTGPECAMSTAGNIPDFTWYSGQDDASTADLESSSGYFHIYNAAASAQTATFNWANASVSGWANVAVAFKAATISGGPNVGFNGKVGMKGKVGIS